VDPLLLILIAGGVLMIFGAGIAILTGRGRSEVDERMERYVAGSGTASAIEDVPVIIEQPDVAERLDKAIGERGFTIGIQTKLAKSDVKLRVSEYFALRLLSGAGVGIAIYLYLGDSLPFGIIGALIGSLLPTLYLRIAAGRRLRAFEDQLSQTLNLWVNALRSGYSVLQSMEAIATELPPPVSVEFERVVQEVRLGLTVDQALANMLRRVPSEDTDLIVTAVNIQRKVGGNLAEVLDTISFTIRERVRIKGEIRTLTAQGRLSGWVISFLPIALGLALMGINPLYMSQIWVREAPFIISDIPYGWLVIAIGLIMMAIGMYAIQRIVDIEV